MLEQLLKIIPPEALLGLIISAIGGGGYLFRKWFLDKLDSDKEQRKAERLELEKRISDDIAKRENERLEIQNQLDQTQSSREMLRLQNSEQVETRNALMKVIESMRTDSQKRDDTHAKYLGEITEVFRGIQSNTAATLELLKQHAESDEAMAIGQSKVINQNETTHQKLSELSSELAEVSQKLESISVGRVGDRKLLDEIKEKLDGAIERVKHIEDVVTNPPETTVNTVTLTANAAPVDANPVQKEFDESEKE